MRLFFAFFKITIVFGLFISTTASNAASLYIFDTPLIYAIKKNGKIFGYYSSSGRDSQCQFLFRQVGNKKNTSFPILAYETDNANLGEAQEIKSNGRIYIEGNQWTIQMGDEHLSGCSYKSVFPDFSPSPKDNGANKFKVIEIVPAQSIKILKDKHVLHDQINGTYKASKAHLTDGDIVTVLKEERNFSLVRYTNPDTTQIIQGWIKSNCLINPFPK
jgi:hypothetical protein